MFCGSEGQKVGSRRQRVRRQARWEIKIRCGNSGGVGARSGIAAKVKKMGRKRVPHRQSKNFIALQLLCLQALAKQTCYQVWSKVQLDYAFGCNATLDLTLAIACILQSLRKLLVHLHMSCFFFCRFLSLRLRHFHHLRHLHWHSSHHLFLLPPHSPCSLLSSVLHLRFHCHRHSSLAQLELHFSRLLSAPLSRTPTTYSSSGCMNRWLRHWGSAVTFGCLARACSFLNLASRVRFSSECTFFFLAGHVPHKRGFLKIGGKPFFSNTRRPSRLKNGAGVRRVLGLGRKGNRC